MTMRELETSSISYDINIQGKLLFLKYLLFIYLLFDSRAQVLLTSSYHNNY